MTTPATRAISVAAKFFGWVTWQLSMSTIDRRFNKIYEMLQPSNKPLIGHPAFVPGGPPFVSSIFIILGLYMTIGTKFM